MSPEQIDKLIHASMEAVGLKAFAQRIRWRFEPKLRGAVARAISHPFNQIELNPSIWWDMDPGDRREVVIHETAHVADAIIHPESRKREYDGHGPNWKAIMAKMGITDPMEAYRWESCAFLGKHMYFSCGCQIRPLNEATSRRLIGGQKCRCVQCGEYLTRWQNPKPFHHGIPGE